MKVDPAVATERRLAAFPRSIHHVHLIGVGGTAMAALAGMLSERGFRVTGSDRELYEPTASLLRGSRVELRTGHSAANLNPAPDLVVVGNVITPSNPEAQALMHSEIPYVSMPEALRHFFLRDRRVLMVAGTHGKTTTTSLIAHVLAGARRDPSMLVGGVAKDFGSNYRLGSGSDFVIEGDEYDTAFFDKGPKFLHYHPQSAIITAVEFDHADIFSDLEHVKSAFRRMVDQMNATHLLVVCGDHLNALEISRDAQAKRLTYGLRNGDFRAVNLQTFEDGTNFSILHRGKLVADRLRIGLGGQMNVANATAAFVLLRERGLDVEEISEGLRTFRGVVRRQEFIGEAAGVTVIDDFAHHPTAITATLDAIADRYPGRRILAAFEPRSNTIRRNVFQADLAQAFDRAARVYLGAVFFKENDPIPVEQRLATAELAGEIRLRGGAAAAYESNAQLLQAMLADCRAGDVAVFMSNGPFDDLKNRFLAGLSA
jgi:UDP-N-acetylmuramate: L-alanyl-gamma-D-glutamyl-meso-diaminopimelate ligase